MKPLICTNPQCKKEVARTDGQQLVFGVVFAGEWKVLGRIRPKHRDDEIKVICDCGRVRSWRREPKTLDNPEHRCYTAGV